VTMGKNPQRESKLMKRNLGKTGRKGRQEVMLLPVGASSREILQRVEVPRGEVKGSSYRPCAALGKETGESFRQAGPGGEGGGGHGTLEVPSTVLHYHNGNRLWKTPDGEEEMSLHGGLVIGAEPARGRGKVKYGNPGCHLHWMTETTPCTSKYYPHCRKERERRIA